MIVFVNGNLSIYYTTVVYYKRNSLKTNEIPVFFVVFIINRKILIPFIGMIVLLDYIGSLANLKLKDRVGVGRQYMKGTEKEVASIIKTDKTSNKIQQRRHDFSFDEIAPS